MNNCPLVSVVIPVYNAESFLLPAVQSILNQTYKNIEIIIVDDGSTDNCLDSIKMVLTDKIKIIRQENFGKSVALNNAISQAKGEFYAIQDADDLSYPTRIEKQVKALLDNNQLAAVFTGHDLIIGSKTVAPSFTGTTSEECRNGIMNLCIPAHDATPMYRLSMVKPFKYNPKFKIGQGVDYILRVGETYNMAVLPECLYSYRINMESNIRKNHLIREPMIHEVLCQACLRRKLPVPKFAPPKKNYFFKHRQTDTHIVIHIMESVLDIKRAGNYWQSFKTTLICMRLHPLDPYYYKPLCYFFIPRKLINLYRSIKNRS